MVANVVAAETIELPDLHLHFHFDNSCNNCCHQCNCSGWSFCSCMGGGRKAKGENFQINNGDVLQRNIRNVYRELVAHTEDVCEENNIDPEHGQLFVIFCFYLRNINIAERGEETLSKAEVRRIYQTMEGERFNWGIYDDLMQRLHQISKRHLRQLKSDFTPKISGMRKHLSRVERRVLRQTMKSANGEAAIRLLHEKSSIREFLLLNDEEREEDKMKAVQVLAQVVDKIKREQFPGVTIPV